MLVRKFALTNFWRLVFSPFFSKAVRPGGVRCLVLAFMKYHDQRVFFSSREWNVVWSLITKGRIDSQKWACWTIGKKIHMDHLGVKIFWGSFGISDDYRFWVSISVKSRIWIDLSAFIRDTSWKRHGTWSCMELLLDILKDVHRKPLRWGPGFWRWCLMQEVRFVSIHKSCWPQNRKNMPAFFCYGRFVIWVFPKIGLVTPNHPF